MTPTLNLPTTETFEDWCGHFQWLFAIRKRAPWALGDWINRGCEDYQSKAFEVANAAFRADEERLQPVLNVCRRFGPNDRYESLKFGHYEAVMKLDDDQARSVLEKAVAGAKPWSVATVKAAAARLQGKQMVFVKSDDGDLEDEEWRAGAQAWNRCSLPAARAAIRASIEDVTDYEEIEI